MPKEQSPSAHDTQQAEAQQSAGHDARKEILLWVDTPEQAETPPRQLEASPQRAPAAPAQPDVAEGSRLGDILIERQRLTREDVQRILEYQRTHGTRFGDAAVALGLLTEQELRSAIAQQYRYPTASNNPALVEFPIAAAPDSAEAEAIRKIRTEIMLRQPERRPLAIAMVSPNDGEGKSYLGSSLALAFAQSGYRTLLIDADLRSPERSTLLGTKTDTGLAAVLAGRVQGYTQPVPAFPKLHVLSAGPPPPNPTEILREPQLKQLINNLHTHFDIFIVDTPAIKRYPDAQIIASQADTAVLVARQHITLLRDIEQAQDALRAAGVQVTGIVYNSFEPSPARTGFWPRLFQRGLTRLRH